MADAQLIEHRLVIPGELGELARVSAWLDAVARDADLADALVFRLQLCLEEAVSNIIRHGFRGRPARPVEITLRLDPHHVAADIVDEGAPFDPTQAAGLRRPATLEEATVGGYGLHLLRQYASAAEYRRDQDRNRLTLTFERAA